VLGADGFGHARDFDGYVRVPQVGSVTVGDDVKILSADQSIYIPVGSVHCLENPGKDPLDLIEVQTGTYLGEDDIVRLDDRYGRT
jgi:mannose-6-phosphate isomerase-like protein (cupin superfamily)